MLAVVLTFGNEVQAVKPELLKKMVTDTVFFFPFSSLIYQNLHRSELMCS